MKLKATIIALTSLFSGVVTASDMFTINQAPASQENPPQQDTTNSNTGSNQATNKAAIPEDASMDEYSDLVRETVAKKTMSLYNFKSLKQESFQYKDVDSDIEYAREFLPPTDGVHDIFNYFIENDVSPGLALLLTYKKLDETLKSMNHN